MLEVVGGCKWTVGRLSSQAAKGGNVEGSTFSIEESHIGPFDSSRPPRQTLLSYYPSNFTPRRCPSVPGISQLAESSIIHVLLSNLCHDATATTTAFSSFPCGVTYASSNPPTTLFQPRGKLETLPLLCNANLRFVKYLLLRPSLHRLRADFP
jgi:hypothetical protein